MKPIIVHLAKSADENHVREQFKKADLIFAQLVGVNYDPSFVTTNHLLSEYPSKVIPWINLYYRGYNPELQYWRDYPGGRSGNPLIDYHITTIIDGVREGLTTNAILDRISCKDWNEDRYAGVASASLTELKLREELTTVHITDVIENEQRRQRLFFTFNHPSAHLLGEYAKRLLNSAGHGNSTFVMSHLPEFLNNIALPINPGFVMDGPLAPRMVQITRDGVRRQELSERDLVDCYQRIYKAHV